VQLLQLDAEPPGPPGRVGEAELKGFLDKGRGLGGEAGVRRGHGLQTAIAEAVQEGLDGALGQAQALGDGGGGEALHEGHLPDALTHGHGDGSRHGNTVGKNRGRVSGIRIGKKRRRAQLVAGFRAQLTVA
jgi:hypothetical protein